LIDLERYRTLLAQDSISKQQVDTQEALVRQYVGAVQSDQGAIDNAKLQLTYARVTAPISGRVGLRQVDPGNIVRASDANGVVVIAELQPINVLYPIPEDNVPRVMQRLASGEAVVVDAWDRDQKTKLATGKLITLDNQIDTATGTVKLKAEFPNDNLALFPNQFVNVRTLIQTLLDATLVPSAAIQRGAPGTFVYVVKDDRSVSVSVTVTGIRSSSGKLRVQLYRATRQDWLEKGRWLHRIEAPARAGSMTFCMPVPEPGSYGIGVRHDANDNGETDLTQDGGGMSNNPSVNIFNLGKPSYDKAAFSVGSGVRSITINMRYL
jgi:multidrug efflux pump subunit AcrA (membrane-fusion protein)